MTRTVLVVLGIVVVALSLTVSVAGGGPESELSIEESLSVQQADDVGNVSLDVREPDETRTTQSPMAFEIVVEGASEGVAAFDIPIEFDTTAEDVNASFVDWNLTKTNLDNTDIADDGSSITLSVALLDNRHEPADEVVVGEAIAVAPEPGEVELDIGAANVTSNVNAIPYAIANSTGGGLTVIDRPQPLPGFDGQPTDLTGDGLLDDVTGNGGVSLGDPLALFDNRGDIDDTYTQFFNFSGTDPSEVSLSDVLVLFDERSERDPE